MKRILILTLAAACIPAALAQKPKTKTTPQPKPTQKGKPAAGVPLTGIYEGTITLPNTLTLRMAFHFDGKGAGTWDSPDQSALASSSQVRWQRGQT